MCASDDEQAKVLFEPDGNKVTAEPGLSLLESAVKAGNRIRSECGGNGKCGKCRVVVKDQGALTGPTAHERKLISTQEAGRGVRLACQAKVKRSVVVFVPPESRVEQRKMQVTGHERHMDLDPAVRKLHIVLPSPTLSDARPDLERLTDALHDACGLDDLEIDHDLLLRLPEALRAADWDATVTVWDDSRVIAVEPGDTSMNVFGAAVDVGTSKIVVYLVDLLTGETRGVGSVENPQIMYGEDLLTRVSYTVAQEDGLGVMQGQAVNGVNEALRAACGEAGVDPAHVYEAVVAGNTVMHHFLLGIDPRHLSVSPFTPAVKRTLNVEAGRLGIEMNAGGVVSALPIVAGFVGADAVADVLSSGVHESGETSLLLDIGTNTEIFLGGGEGLTSCSCASGPAFEGGHIRHGMKAVTGAIERITIDPATYRTRYETIGDVNPRGLCGSAMIDVVAELWRHKIIDDTGKFNQGLETSMLKETDRKTEFVLVPEDESATGHEIVVTQRDVNEVQRAKAAIYAGCSLLLRRMKLAEGDIAQILVAGAFGRSLNPENAKTIGLVPDVPVERVRFLGNTAVTGAKMALTSRKVRVEAEELSRSVGYLELSADPLFGSEFASALFIPHRDPGRFPSVKRTT
jgi:uncharacterized 2Fe-2S/4Fe-4S cluster protein (DUF4445 family)